MRTRTRGALAAALLLLVTGCTTTTAPAAGPATPATPPPPVPAFAAQLRPKLTEAMARLKLPGAIVEVTVPGQGTWLEALGSGSTDGRTPITIDDHIRIGSVTKSVTAEVVLQLADAGKLRLDDPVAKYLPQIPDGDRVTVRALLAMTAGLFNFTEDDYFNRTQDEHPPKVWTVDEALATALAHPPYFAPGAGFHYSNTNYEVLGLIAQKTGGAPLGTLMHDLVFAKLGMSSTTLPAVDDGAIPQPHPRGYMYGTNVQGNEAYKAAVAGNQAGARITVPDGAGPADVTDDPVPGPASGGLISTARDMTIWAKALGTGELLNPATQAARTDFGDNHYGLGMEQAAGGLIGHNGAVPGFQSFVGYQPRTGATVVVLTNLLVAPNTYFGEALPADTLAGVVQQTLLPTA